MNWQPVEMKAAWTTGFNMPGYMPDPDAVDHHATWEEARDSLIATIESHMDHDGKSSENDAVWNQQVNAADELRTATAGCGTEVEAGQFVYWIAPLEEGAGASPRVLRVPGKLGVAVEKSIALDIWLSTKPTEFFLRDNVYDDAHEQQAQWFEEALDETRMEDDVAVNEVRKFFADDTAWYFETIDDPLDVNQGVLAFIHDETGETIHVVGLNHATAYGA